MKEGDPKLLTWFYGKELSQIDAWVNETKNAATSATKSAASIVSSMKDPFATLGGGVALPGGGRVPKGHPLESLGTGVSTTKAKEPETFAELFQTFSKAQQDVLKLDYQQRLTKEERTALPFQGFVMQEAEAYHRFEEGDPRLKAHFMSPTWDKMDAWFKKLGIKIEERTTALGSAVRQIWYRRLDESDGRRRLRASRKGDPVRPEGH